MIDKTKFLARFPAFTTDDFDKYYNDTECWVELFYEGRCGTACQDELKESLVLAHLMELMKKVEVGKKPLSGIIQSKSADGISINFAALQPMSTQDRFWDSTAYGQMFAQATSHCGIGAFAV